MSSIAHFGIGFHSAFLIADRVVVTSKHNSDKGGYCHQWESSANGSFLIRNCIDPELTRGTKIQLFVNLNEEKYLEPGYIRDVVQQYAQSIGYPIKLLVGNEWKGIQKVEGEEEVPMPTAKGNFKINNPYNFD